MNKAKIIVCILFLSVLSQKGLQAQTKINQVDDKGLKHGPWVGYYEDTKNLKYEGQFEHGKEMGTFTFYDNTKVKSVVATRIFNPKDNSAYTIFYKGKHKVSEGKVIDKKHEGEWKYYHFESDAIMTVENYRQGKLHGTRKVYFKYGELAEEAEYSEGIKHGLYKKYAENGTVLEESSFKNGVYHGPVIFRNPLGKTVATGQYKNGTSVGVWKFYENEKLIREENRSERKKGKPKSENPQADKRKVKERKL